MWKVTKKIIIWFVIIGIIAIPFATSTSSGTSDLERWFSYILFVVISILMGRAVFESDVKDFVNFLKYKKRKEIL